MKIQLSFILCIIQCVLFAQDTIYKRSGEIISAKVLEINIKEISYKRYDMQDGPLFIINKNDIKKIRYYNGTLDSFTVVKEILPQQLSNSQSCIYTNNMMNEIKTSVRRGVYYYHGKRFSDRNVVYLVNDKNIIWNNDEIEYQVSKYKHKKALQYSIGFGGAALGGVTLVGCLSATDYNSNPNDNYITATIAAAGASVLIASQVLSATFKFKAINHANKLAELFNQFSRK